MTEITAYHKLGELIVGFQRIEEQLDDLIVLLCDADDELIRILMNELEFSKRINTLDVMFARFVDIRKGIEKKEKNNFHTMIVKISKLSQRRNDLVHSKYCTWRNIEGKYGFIRENSKLRGSKGIREEHEEELLPESFDSDIEEINERVKQLEKYRLQIIDCFCSE